MAEQRQYDEEYKVQAIKLAEKIGPVKAAGELGVPKNTLYGWIRKAQLGYIDLGKGIVQTLSNIGRTDILEGDE